MIKLYADYRWGKDGEAKPTFSQEEIEIAVSTAKNSGRKVVVHAATVEGMTRAINAGVSTIEHGDDGNEEDRRGEDRGGEEGVDAHASGPKGEAGLGANQPGVPGSGRAPFRSGTGLATKMALSGRG